MTEALMRKALVLFVVGIMAGFAGTPALAVETMLLPIGYLEITDDPRYEEKRAYARIRVRPHDRPRPGAEMAVRESRVLGRALKIKFSLERAEAKTATALVSEIRRMAAAGQDHPLCPE